MSDPDETSADSKAERRLRKQAEQAAESNPLDPWERYRALNDLVDHMLDVIEMADRRTRFALLLLGSLNAANLLMVARGDISGVTLVNTTLVRLYVGSYLGLSLYSLIHAVNALKPRAEGARQRRGRRAHHGGEICGVAKGLQRRHDSARTDSRLSCRAGAASHRALDRVRIIDLHGASIPE
jgi:hypothetical protein